MTQVRKEYLRWIVAHFWNTGRNYSSKHLRVRNLPNGSPNYWKFREECLTALKELSQDEFEQIRNEARVWICSLPNTKMQQVLGEYDGTKKPHPLPHRVQWVQVKNQSMA